MDAHDVAVISQLYESVLEVERLPLAIQALVEAVNGDTCHLVGWEGPNNTPFLSVTSGLSAEIGPTYSEHYATLDPRRQKALKDFLPGQVMACHQQFSPIFVSRNEFYQDYLLPLGIHYLLASTLIQDGSQLVQIALQRYKGHEQFSEDEISRFLNFVPHLQRVTRLASHKASLEQQITDAHAGLTSNSTALITVSAASYIRYCNPMAEALLKRGDPFTGLNRRFAFVDPQQQAWLTHSITQVARTGLPMNQLICERKGNFHRFSVTLMPCPTSHKPRLLNDSAREAEVICIIIPIDQRRIATVKQLMQFFKLTPAEARLARELASGKSLEACSHDQGVRLTTVKTHMSSILSKTGSSRQADVIRIIASLPAVRESAQDI